MSWNPDLDFQIQEFSALEMALRRLIASATHKITQWEAGKFWSSNP
jgi:hypothetical protein